MAKVLGFDVSSTTIGWSLLELVNNNIIFIECGFIKPTKNGTSLERLADTRNKILYIINEYKPDYIGIEDIIQFMAGASTAKTIITLTSFNRMIGLVSYDYLHNMPALFNVLSIRHGLKIDKKLPKKEDMPELVAYHLNIKFPYIFNKKGKIKVESYDMADGVSVALYYAFILTNRVKGKKEMNLKEAYSILEVTESSSPEEIKKAFKKKATIFHPDKPTGNEDLFKKINQAYQTIQSGDQGEVNNFQWGNPFHINLNDIFGAGGFTNNNNSRQHNVTHIETSILLSIKEAIQGSKKEIKYSRFIKCPHCQGNGQKPINNGCKKCNGRGQISSRRRDGVTFITTCTECFGKAKTIECTDCNQGLLSAEAVCTIVVPPEVAEGNILRLQNMGNFIRTVMGIQDQYTDVLVNINIIAESGLILKGKEVVVNITIPLLDALTGCSRVIKTIDGTKEIEIPGNTRNGYENVLNLQQSDNSNIAHRIIVNVDYPDDIKSLVNFLSIQKSV